MERSRYILAYDIADDRRRDQVHTLALANGFSLQYSVFVCDLTAIELIDLRVGLREKIDHRKDAIAIIDLGPSATRGMDCFEFLGRFPTLPKPGGPTIV